MASILCLGNKGLCRYHGRVGVPRVGHGFMLGNFVARLSVRSKNPIAATSSAASNVESS